ncbi:MAG: MATE family efflux transporter [Lachnospiraceae bacterium]|nr:MATE family efflux transporter [Lachnospiraceae bacterium]
MLYSNKDLKKLIGPLIMEQLLAILVGLADTVMIAGEGEAAMSGVSLVDTINILIINIFAALSTGGAVVAGHFLGQKDSENACKSAWQLMLFSIVSSLVITVLFIGFHSFLLRLIFGQVEAAVMQNAKTYLVLTAVSICPLAVYNGCAALFRAMGNSKTTMLISILMNGLNVVGNAVLIYGAKIGVAGAAVSTSFSRVVAMVIILVMMFNGDRVINFKGQVTVRMDGSLIKKILHIGIPNGLENSLFQLGKILLLSLVTTFGTYAIAANSICNALACFNVLPGTAINYALLSVAAVCIGAGEYEQARYYTKRLMLIAMGCIAAISVIFIIFAPRFVGIYRASEETARMAAQVLRWHAFMAIFAWAPSFTLPNTLRASGDVIVPMVIAIVSMWTFRIGTAYAFSYFFDMGLLGVWVAMTIDWVFRAICYGVRYHGNKWQGIMEKNRG